jgi:hypothetical protein
VSKLADVEEVEEEQWGRERKKTDARSPWSRGSRAVCRTPNVRITMPDPIATILAYVKQITRYMAAALIEDLGK